MFPARHLHKAQSRSRLFDQLVKTDEDQIPSSLELYLACRGMISADDMIRVTALSQRQDASQAEIVTRLGMVDDTDVARSQALRLGEQFLELEHDPPNPKHVQRWGYQRCLQTGVMPWRMRNGYTVIATSQPEYFDRQKDALEYRFGPVRRAFATESDIQNCVSQLGRAPLTRSAEHRVADEDSCRTLNANLWRIALIAVGSFSLVLWIVQPTIVFLILSLWAVIALIANTTVRILAARQYLIHRNDDASAPTGNNVELARHPRISIMVPLFKERAIATKLVQRLKRIDYPKELLDIHLVIEEDDETTRATLAETSLPIWIKTQVVPPGGLKTKPRALNYALDFCKGSIIGVYDAEDAPDPDQLNVVVRRFAQRGPNVVCLQGVLDFYNPRANWLARCFAIEYATWFRIVLPGLERMGLPVPLGGTTLFFRRQALEDLGAWDAHNVTEDADLGIRLRRRGYSTELVPTVTYEEANCRPWPWVKQRSRWLKGYAMTWAVHMRNPRALLRDLGWTQFVGVQILFLGTLSGFVLAPFLWSFWLIPLGIGHPLSAVLPGWVFWLTGAVFLLSEGINIAVGCFAVSGKHHRHLLKWVPTLHFYFPLAAMASYKALWELITKPFYWDKTTHGISAEDADAAPNDDQSVIQPPHALTVSQKPDLGAVSQLHTQLLRRGTQ